MENCIEVNHLVKVFKGRKVIDDISFRVKKGEVYGILGHNGAGKSTTINCILGLTKPNQGDITLLGQHVNLHRKTLFERVGVQLQHSHYQDNITVKEICIEMSIVYSHPVSYMDLLQKFDLIEFVDEKVEKLSGGEKQKLSLVLSLLCDPEVVFLDELTTGLDVETRRKVWHLLKELKSQNKTLFLSSHYMEEVKLLCDRILILNKGKKVIEGSVKEIIKQSPYHHLEEAYLWYMKSGNAK